jgi:hypothetical protein
MKKTIIFMAVIAMIASCKKKEADANLSKPEEALSADIALTVKRRFSRVRTVISRI